MPSPTQANVKITIMLRLPYHLDKIFHCTLFAVTDYYFFFNFIKLKANDSQGSHGSCVNWQGPKGRTLRPEGIKVKAKDHGRSGILGEGQQVGPSTHQQGVIIFFTFLATGQGDLLALCLLAYLFIITPHPSPTFRLGS